MKKKIYDESANSFIHAILDNLDGSDQVSVDYYLDGGRTERHIYHVSPGEVTVAYYFKWNGSKFTDEKSQAEIWLYGTEQAIGELEARIFKNMHQYCEDPLKYVKNVIKKKNKSTS